MKVWMSEHTFNHPWETVASAAWRKYPNPITPSVLGTDVIDRRVVNGVLHTHRLVSSQWGFPRWTKPLIGDANICYASENSEVDPGNRLMVLRTRNLTFYNYITVDETVTYTPHPQDTSKTLLTQEAVVKVHGVPLTHYMEDLLTSKISFNAGKGRQAIEWVIDKIDAEVKDLANSAAKTTDELLNTTRRQIDDLTNITKRSMDEIQSAAKKSFEEVHNLTTPPSHSSMPKL
ncbi:protein slowmo [Nasonia vitripennis]|uniref:PRELI/MSF1 domain-containing protein n=1 Tax=Nasonia vitripennis TaxID=7425 RepID=A0A7M7QY91_NASVI|nr:protein slowmo [Nasonia vitripennis]XP_032456478.1 protein slowmo [Nasonia vitripennis]XP_032456479.1 protein slowmo [Nasonia vitripennis]